jgi:uncharacterized LabA/DUF88 family protein
MKTAVFYDLENIGLTSKNGEFENSINDLVERIKGSGLVSEIVLQRAYISKSHPSIELIQPVVKKLKIELIQVEPLSESSRRLKNLVDFKMGVDLVATIAGKRSIGTVALASGDNDFGFLCQQIKDMGRKLLIISRYETTGDVMFRLCDDWIDLNGHVLSQKIITEAISHRITGDYTNMGFIPALNAFLTDIENDLLLRRWLTDYGIYLQFFVNAVQERQIPCPDHKELGFNSLTYLINTLLCETNFECKNGTVKYTGNKKEVSQRELINNLVKLPVGYSREKLLVYHDTLSGVENIDEMLTYINFMKRNNMLTDGKLCYKRTFKSTIRKYLKKRLALAGIELDKGEMTEFEVNL